MTSSPSSSNRRQSGARQRLASYAHGTSPVPLLGETLAAILDRHAHATPTGVALMSCHQNRQLTFGELHDAATRVACGLIALGVRPGDRIGLWAANSAEWIIGLFAAAKIGAPCVGINPAFRARELERVLTDAQVTTLVLNERFNDNECADILAELAPELRQPGDSVVRARRLPALRRVVHLEPESSIGGIAWAELLRDPSQEQVVELEARQAACDIDDCALILYTRVSGGRCKGVSHSHHSVVNGGYFVGVHLGYSSADWVCIPVPLFHVFGLVAGAIGALSHGATVVLPSPMFDASRCLDALQRYQCSVVFGVPTMLAAMLEHPARTTFDVRSLRTGVVSGAACPAPLMRRAIEELPVPGLTVGYGMTEIGPVLYSAPDDSTDQRTRITGRVQGHMQCKIVDSAGRTVPCGERGELLSKGYGLMQGYIGDHADAPSPVDRAGWIRTGDLAVMSETGEVTIVGRLKDLIIRGGENIAPGEIEEVLAAHPAVIEAHVVGVPDERYGDEVCATVRLRDGDSVSEPELKRFCRERLATYKVPRYFRFAADFPRTSTGKVQKAVLRDLAIAQFKLEPRPAADAVQ